MAKHQDEFLPTRRSLLYRLKDWEDQKSWGDFFNTYGKLIYSAAIKSGLTDAEAQDVVQETVITVSKKIRDFRYDPAAGSFKGWLLNITRWRIADQFRKRSPADRPRRRAPDESDRTATVERIPDPAGPELAAVWEEEWQKNILEAALQRVKRQVNPKQYQIFDLYVMKNWPVEKVAETLGVSVNQVYLSKHRIGELMKQEIKRAETATF